MNKLSRALLISAGLLASSIVIAAPVTDSADFQAKKDRSIANLQEKLQIVQEHLSCVQAATDMAGLKTCHQTAKAKNRALAEKLKVQRPEKKAGKRSGKKDQIPDAPEL